MSWLSAAGGQSIGDSALASVLPMNIQGWYALGLTGWISLLSKRLSRAFSSITIQKHKFFSTQPSLWSNSHIRTWLLEKPLLWLYGKVSWWACGDFLVCYLLFFPHCFKCFLSLIFVSSINMCLISMFLLGLILYGTLYTLDLSEFLLSQVREIFVCNLFKYFLRPFLSSSSPGISYNANAAAFNAVPEVSVTVLISTFLCILFCSGDFYHSVFQLTYLFFGLIYSIYSF